MRASPVLLTLAALVSAASLARAQPEEREGKDVPSLEPAGDETFDGAPVVAVDVESVDPTFSTRVAPRVRVGDVWSPMLARRAVRELFASGTVADARVDVEREAGGVHVRFSIVPQRIAEDVRVSGPLDATEALRNVGLERGRPITGALLRRAEAELRAHAATKGFPDAHATVLTRTTDDPKAVVVLVTIEPGAARRLAGLRVDVDGVTTQDDVRDRAGSWGPRSGLRIDEDDFTERDRLLAQRLRSAGYHRAVVEHRTYEVDGKSYVQLRLRPGPRIALRLEGNDELDRTRLEDVADLEHEPDRSPSHVAQKIRDEYRKIGFLDAEVSASERGEASDPIHHLVVSIREHARVRVAARSYPCLEGERSPGDVGSEIDSYLEEELPGATLLSPVDPGSVDAIFGPQNATGARPAPLDLTPRSVYAPETYDHALKHVQDLYRSEGYLGAVVGPAQVLRRTCDPRSPAGRCLPLPLPKVDAPLCALAADGTPAPEPELPAEALCRPDPVRHVSCEPAIFLRIPILPGPKATLYDVAFDGVSAIPQADLLAASGLTLGDPASNVKIEEARRLILDRYRDEGFAFAEVQAAIELSPDRRRARARITVVERQRVIVEGIDVRGNDATLESVVRGRLRFEAGDVYRQRDVRQSEELLATLGTFSSVTVGLEDPTVPATRKRVLVTVAERPSQYLEVRPGVSTGEGVRGLLEYGHRNLGGRAIALTLRVQLGYLPDFLIPEDGVRQNFDKLTLGERLERRNSIGIAFPTVVDPRVRFNLDLVDVRSNARDFGLSKDAVLPTFTVRLSRTVTFSVGVSGERNDVNIFSGQTVLEYLAQAGISNDLARLLRVPDGLTYVLAERGTIAWDRRDNPLGATRGTLLAATTEHVHAYPAEGSTVTSDFLRYTGTASAYKKLTRGGVVFALSLRAGYIQQLIANSKTYPDRLFFLGGVDNFRGAYRDSLTPQDLADKIAADAHKSAADPTKFTINQVAIRGGDFFVNPRAELRVPLRAPFETAFFVDAGNLWVDPKVAEPWRLRYAGGTGVRVATPIGPVALDYGINLTRRPWEDFGAFNFSVGLF